MRSRWTFIAVFILTAFDIILTYVGLQSGSISEANPIMAFMLEKSRILSCMGVLVGVAAALYFFYRVRARVKWLSGALAIVLAVKASVILLHLQWIFGA